MLNKITSYCIEQFENVTISSQEADRRFPAMRRLTTGLDYPGAGVVPNTQ